VTASLATTPSNAVISVSRYSGVNPTSPIGNVLSGNTNGLNGTCDGGTDSSAYNYELNVVSAGAYVFGAVAIRNKSHSPGAGFNERIEITAGNGGNMAGLAIQDKSVAAVGLTAVDGSFNRDVDWAVIGLEIRPS